MERLRNWVHETWTYRRHTATLRDFGRLMQVRLSQSKIGRLVCPRPVVARVNVPALGGDVWLRSHTTDIAVLTEQLAAQTYRGLDRLTEVHTVVDLGANTGLVARWLLARYPDARVVCVEPEPRNVRMLETNLAHMSGRAAIVPKCVGGTERTARIETDTGAWGYRIADGPGEIEVTTMDRIVRDHRLDRIDILKCDIEGAEREVFENCSTWIGRVRFAVVECHDFPAERIVPQGWRLLDRHGWAAQGIETISLIPGN